MIHKLIHCLKHLKRCALETPAGQNCVLRGKVSKKKFNLLQFFQLLSHKIFICHTVSESCHSNSRNTPNLQNQTLIISLWLSFQFHKTQHTVLYVTHTNLTGINIMAKVFAFEMCLWYFERSASFCKRCEVFCILCAILR